MYRVKKLNKVELISYDKVKYYVEQEFYIVDKDDIGTLLKNFGSVSSKTFLITKADIGRKLVRQKDSNSDIIWFFAS